MARSVLAVFAGLLLTMLLIVIATMIAVKIFIGNLEQGAPFQLSTSYIVTNLIYSSLITGLGGYVTATIAERYRLLHAGVLAGLLFVFSLAAYAQNANQPQARQQPRWYAITLIFLGPVCVMIGALLKWLKSRHSSVPSNAE